MFEISGAHAVVHPDQGDKVQMNSEMKERIWGISKCKCSSVPLTTDSDDPSEICTDCICDSDGIRVV